MAEAMDIDADELKKCARTSQLLTKQATTLNHTTGENQAPKVKKSCNNEMPPPHIKAKALFIKKHTDKMQNDMVMEEQYEVTQETHLMLQELTAVNEDDFEERPEKQDDTNKTAEGSEMMKKPASATQAQITEKDTKESSLALTMAPQATVSDHMETGR